MRQTHIETPIRPDADALDRARALCRVISDCVMEEGGRPPCTADNCMVYRAILAAKARGRMEERERLKTHPKQ